MKKIILLLMSVFWFSGFSLQAQTTLTGGSGAIPDNQCPALAPFSATMAESGAVGTDWEIQNVTLDITHTWDGDLYIHAKIIMAFERPIPLNLVKTLTLRLD